jgi:hypothetical protein
MEVPMPDSLVDLESRRAGVPRHGPHFRLTRRMNGKSVAETFPSAASLAKA